MIPNVTVKAERKLTVAETNELFETKIKQNADFQAIVEKLSVFEEETLEFAAANQLELEYEGEGTVQVERVIIKSGDSVVAYHHATKDGVTKEDVVGSVVIADELHTSFIKEGELETAIVDYDGELEQDFQAGISQEDIAPLYNWGDGCYPTFKHCGKNCGDNGDYGGGTPKNAYDTCCRTHDRCWANFGTNNCSCDCKLISCAKANYLLAPAALHLIVVTYFPVKDSCSC